MGGVVGGIVGWALICLAVFIVRSRLRERHLMDQRRALQSMSFAAVRDPSWYDSPGTSPSTVPMVPSFGNENTVGAFPTDTIGIPPSAYHPNTSFLEMGTAKDGKSNFSSPTPPALPLPFLIGRSTSQVSPPSGSQDDGNGNGSGNFPSPTSPALPLPFLIGRSTSQVPPSTGSQDGGRSFVHTEGVVPSYKPEVPRGGPSTNADHSLGLHEDRGNHGDLIINFVFDSASLQDIELGGDGRYSQIGDWGSTVGSPPPPSYHTRQGP